MTTTRRYLIHHWIQFSQGAGWEIGITVLLFRSWFTSQSGVEACVVYNVSWMNLGLFLVSCDKILRVTYVAVCWLLFFQEIGDICGCSADQFRGSGNLSRQKKDILTWSSASVDVGLRFVGFVFGSRNIP